MLILNTCVYQLVSSKQIQALSFVQLCDGWQRRRPYTRVVSVFLGGWFWGKTHRILGEKRVITLGFTWKSAESGKVWCTYIYTYIEVKWNIDRIIGWSPASWDRFISKKEGMAMGGLFWMLWSLCSYLRLCRQCFSCSLGEKLGNWCFVTTPKTKIAPLKKEKIQPSDRILKGSSSKPLFFFSGDDMFLLLREVNQVIGWNPLQVTCFICDTCSYCGRQRRWACGGVPRGYP